AGWSTLDDRRISGRELQGPRRPLVRKRSGRDRYQPAGHSSHGPSANICEWPELCPGCAMGAPEAGRYFWRVAAQVLEIGWIASDRLACLLRTCQIFVLTHR